jgi:tetratricopeptide (TPR) repeat protein
MSLHLSEGNAIIKQELRANPYNLMATYLADYDDCLLLLFNGDARDYEQRRGHLEERLNLLSKGDDNSPWYRFTKAGLYFHWALVYVRFGENFKAATNFRKSFLLLKENTRLFPSFPQNKIFLGVEQAVVGTVPDDYKWIASIFGMKGDVKKGIGQLASFIKTTGKDDPLRNEAIIYYSYLRFYLLSQQEDVWNYISSNEFPIQDNLFHAFMRTNLAINYRKAEVALQTLNKAQAVKDYSSFPIFDYEMGSALLYKMDPNCVIYHDKFLSRYNGKLFIKDALQQKAISYYLQKDLNKANYFRRQIATRGTKQADADKQAQRFSEGSSWPPVVLVQARLLTDGGYYSQALQKLQAADVKSFGISEKLEYYFRLGRIYDELKEETKALELYQTTINIGRTRQEHFAARSALQMGLLYERKRRIAEAVAKYKECLSMKNHDFQSNIDQQAKAGINRLTGK